MKPKFEHVRRSGDSSFSCLEFEGALFDCPYHVHPEVEILLIDSGRGRFLVGEKVGRFAPKDLFLFGANLPHMFDSDPMRAQSRKAARSRYIQFEPACLGPGFMDLPELQKVRSLLKLAHRGLRFPSGRFPDLVHPFCAAHSAKGAAKIATLLILLENLASARNFELLATEGYLSRQTHPDSDRLDRAFGHIHSHLNGNLTLAETAKAASYSPQAFSRFFHQHVGMTFQDYVIDLRLLEACRMLIETDRTIAEICFQTGFKNLSNFNRQFLAHKKMAPRRYRQLAAPAAP